ncbi:hypothetical protein ACFQVD_26695 [Streptosporangium amethystogenes subsp. fukuiense]|uniref:Uncharacterized protein n=1 Tax=Streptosporangium amethystogenes subsp. fukuiense TaxID=698418 RepID=A0ABW2T566_9ACTN
MTDLRDRIVAAIHDSEDSCSRCKSCDRQHNAVMAVITPELERAAFAARNCARNTDLLSELIRAVLLIAHKHGPVSAVRVLGERAADFDGLLDGLDLPAANPPAPAQPASA